MQSTILIADDHSLTRRGLRNLCEQTLGYSQVQEVANREELLAEIGQNEYSHLILDIDMGEGNSLELLPEIRRNNPDLLIAIVTMKRKAIYANILKEYGIKFYLNKGAMPDETTRFFRNFLTSDVVVQIGKTRKKNPLTFPKITSRQMQILHYWLQGARNQEIAAKLEISDSTVSKIKTTILKKTNTTNLMELQELLASNKISPITD